MKLLKLKPKKLTLRTMILLEKKGLIKRFKPTKNVLEVKKGKDAVDILYTTSTKFGSHKLICVGKNFTKIQLNTHPDNEDFIIFNPTNYKFKPLYLIIGLNKYKIIEKKAKNNTLTSKDILAIELVYNNPKLSLFTMLKGTPHCEITVEGKRKHPIFFVTEPTKLTWHILDIQDYKLELF